MAQEVHGDWPAIRNACGQSIFGHAMTLEDDINAAMKSHGISGDWTAESLARHTQTVAAIERGEPLEKIVAGWQQELAAFREVRKKHLLYRR